MGWVPQARKQGGHERKARLQQAQAQGQRIVIDLGFEDRMTEAQVRSLCQQLLHSYAANGRAEKPAHLILTSLQVPVLAPSRITCLMLCMRSVH